VLKEGERGDHGTELLLRCDWCLEKGTLSFKGVLAYNFSLISRDVNEKLFCHKLNRE
jgi:hypothetical protein